MQIVSLCVLLLYQGEVVLPFPSVEVLAEAAATPARRSAVLHVLESTIVGWMKQIKVSILFLTSL